MLEGLRAVQNTWAGRAILAVVLVVIIVSFAFWGIGDIFKGFNADQVAQVGGTKITTAEFRQAYQTELQNLQQRARRPVTNEEAHRFGLDAQVLTRLISDAVLDNRTQALGLAMSDAQLASAIKADPAFAGPGGTFERGRYDAELRDNGYNVRTFERERRRIYLRQELIQALVGGLATPTAVAEPLHRYAQETRSLDYLVLPASAAGEVPAPDETALQGFFDAHAPAFAAPQYRRFVVLALTPAGLAKPDEVADADAKQLYDGVKDARFAAPERRTVGQILFPSEAEAAAASSRIKAGARFADIAAERKLDDKAVDLGTVTKDQLFDPAIAEAAFALPADGTSEPVKGAFGPVLIHVAAVEPAAVKPYEAVAATLKTEIATRRAADTLRTLHDRIEDARSSGQSLTEAAKAVGAEAKTIEAVDAAGLDKDGKPVEGIPERDALLKAGFASDVGVDNDTVQTRDGGLIWFEVANIEQARPRTLAEVRPRVEAALRADETTRRLSAKAAELVTALDGGKTVEQVAASLGNLPVSHAADVKRSGGTGLPAAAAAAAFDGPVGRAGSAPAGADARILFKVLDAVVPPLDPDSQNVKTIADRYRAEIADDIVGAYLAKAGSELGARVNQDALRAAAGAAS